MSESPEYFLTEIPAHRPSVFGFLFTRTRIDEHIKHDPNSFPLVSFGMVRAMYHILIG